MSKIRVIEKKETQSRFHCSICNVETTDIEDQYLQGHDHIYCVVDNEMRSKEKKLNKKLNRKKKL